MMNKRSYELRHKYNKQRQQALKYNKTQGYDTGEKDSPHVIIGQKNLFWHTIYMAQICFVLRDNNI